MRYQNCVSVLFPLLLCCCYSLVAAQNLPYKAVNLGNWLVTEGWMKPSLFDGIVNKDLLDGTQVQLKSIKLQKFLVAENGGGTGVSANRDSASGWETFTLWRVNDSTFNFRVFSKQFFGLDAAKKLVATSNSTTNPETFQIIRNTSHPSKIRIQASNGLFLQAQSETVVSADYKGSTNWEDSDPSVFNMTTVKTLQGEYQITNGYGPNRAPQVLQDHWNTYITEEDFRFMSQNGLTAVRIPVGWWIAYDPNPPKPFVGGSLAALDNDFTWAQNHGMKVIVDLHAVQGSQNGNDHSGTRDGYIEWGDSYIPDTVTVIDFLAKRYANKLSLGGIELMNEPTLGPNLDSLKKYYQQAYDAVRKYAKTTHVIMSNPLDHGSKELLSFAGGFDRVVIDVHYYNLFGVQFRNMNVQQNIDYIYNQTASDLNGITTSNGPLSFVGEWTAEWNVQGASKEDYQRFAKAQLDVYSRASFGWAYWAYKCQFNHWSLKWMIENGYIKL
ncbi:probable glucan 1,3-beta-glucosidase A [Prosopis cineraria]|uniref:probable glucan 1,3-beta-glucosidase A n=1 Tax=Prosopis cineraria TaxID=364024 RepID=UPI00240F1BF1|nr:probable glucan 1,3-beta-glucosidase A [Prosopis cineraria]